MQNHHLMARWVWVTLCCIGLLGSTPGMALAKPWQITHPDNGANYTFTADISCDGEGPDEMGSESTSYILQLEQRIAGNPPTVNVLQSTSGECAAESWTDEITNPESADWPHNQTLYLALYSGGAEKTSITIDITN